jgi:uncharacterized phage protein gp47/JayE
MATFPTPSSIQQQYLQILKSLKPSFNPNDPNSDFVIRGKAVSGLASGLYGDQQKVNNDTYISSARLEALLLHGQDLGISRQPATAAKTPQARITGTDGTLINPGDLTFLYAPTNVVYTNTTGGTIAGGLLDLEVECTVVGQVGNIVAPDDLQVVAPPPGVDPTSSLLQNMADGADIETVDSYRARLLSRRQQPPAGGNEIDYPNFAFEADPSVRSAFIRRFGRGLGTVDIYITTGTTDIDTAVTQGQAILRIPGPATLAAVQAYYNANVPYTDCPAVYAPTEVDIDVTVKVVLAAGLTLASVPANATYNPLGLTCQQLIEREVGRALYKVPVGGRIVPGNTQGQVVAADIEESLDEWLSAVSNQNTGGSIGKLPILADRQVQPLDPPNVNKVIVQNQLVAPNIITVIQGV